MMLCTTNNAKSGVRAVRHARHARLFSDCSSHAFTAGTGGHLTMDRRNSPASTRTTMTRPHHAQTPPTGSDCISIITTTSHPSPTERGPHDEQHQDT